MSANEVSQFKMTRTDHNAVRRFKRKMNNPKRLQEELEKMKKFQEEFLKSKKEGE